jgi:MFS family permease
MRRLFLLVAAVVLVDSMFYSSITPLLPHYSDELELSKSAAGVLSASYAAGTLLFSLPGGYLAARVGVKPTTLIGLFLISGSSVAFAFADDVVVLDGARFVQGIGGACTWSGALAWLLEAAPSERRGELIGSALAAAIGGFLLGPLLGGAATATSPKLVFSFVSLAGLVLAGWTLVTPAAVPREPPTLGEVGSAIMASGVLVGFWLVALPALFSGVLNVLVPLRLDALGASGLAIGAIFLVAALAEGILSPVLGRLSDRHGRLAPIRWGLAGAIALAYLLPLPGAVGLQALALLATVMALATFWAPAMALLSDAAEASGLAQGFAFALVNLAWAGGQMVGGGAGSRAAEATSDSVPYAVVGVLCLATLVAVVARERRAVAA